MICEKCGKENKENTRFCEYCESQLNSKIQCERCKSWVNVDYNFCPICRNNLNKRTYSLDQSYYCKITQGVMIFLTVVMVLLLFGSISSYKAVNYSSNEVAYNKSNVVDNAEASIKGLLTYTDADYQKENGYLNQYQFKERVEKIHLLNFYMVDEYSEHMIFYKLIIYVNTVIMLTILFISVILVGLSINQFIKDRFLDIYKKLLLINIILAFVLSTTITLIGHRVGFSLILLIAFLSISLLTSYISEVIRKERDFNKQIFIFRLILIVSLMVLILTTSVNIFKLNGSTLKQGVNIGGFTLLINELLGEGNLAFFDTNYTYIVGSYFRDHHPWVMNASLAVSVLMIGCVSLMIISLAIELAKSTKIIKVKINTSILTWIAFAFEGIVLMLSLFIIKGFNQYIEEVQHIQYSLHLASGIFVLIFATLAYQIYKLRYYL